MKTELERLEKILAALRRQIVAQEALIAQLIARRDTRGARK